LQKRPIDQVIVSRSSFFQKPTFYHYWNMQYRTAPGEYEHTHTAMYHRG
jgi:hypothetical protein